MSNTNETIDAYDFCFSKIYFFVRIDKKIVSIAILVCFVMGLWFGLLCPEWFAASNIANSIVYFHFTISQWNVHVFPNNNQWKFEGSNHYERCNGLEKNSKLGHFNGLFNLVHNFKKICGPIIGAITLHFGASISVMYCILSLLSFIGSLGFLFLTPMDEPSSGSLDDIPMETVNTLNVTKQETVGLLHSEHSDTESVGSDHDGDNDGYRSESDPNFFRSTNSITNRCLCL